MIKAMFILGASTLLLLTATLRGMAGFGSPDLSFDAGDTDSIVQQIVVQPDHRILIGGQFSRVDGVSRQGVARLNFDGTLDHTFQPGTGIEGGMLHVLRLQPDGRILVAGTFAGVNGLQRPRIARLLPDGRVDRDFEAPIPTGTAIIYDLVLQADGRIIIAGNFSDLGGVERVNLARLHPDGALDLSFDAPGGVVPIYSLLLAPDEGTLLAGANRFQFGPITDNSLRRDFVARYFTASGAWDPSFQFQPAAAVGISSFTYPGYFLRLPDGNVLLGGMSGTGASFQYAGFIKMSPDGVMDGEFRTGPVQQTATIGRPIDAGVRLPGGQLIGVGRFNTVQGQPRTNAVALLPDGLIDPAFDPGEGADMVIYSVAFQADGRILIGGAFNTVDGHPRRRIARLQGPGSPPVITLQPSSLVKFSGEEAVFEVGVIGDPDPVVQWYRAGEANPVGTGPRLVIDSVALLTHAGEYHAVASNTHGQVTSATVTLTVELAAPEFTRQPVELRISQGGLAVLSAAAVGSQPMTYQWYVNGAPMTDGTNAVQEIEPAWVGGHPFSENPSGTYQVVASNPLGSTTSATATYHFSSACVVDPSFFTVEELIQIASGCGSSGCHSTSQFSLSGTRQMSLGPGGLVYAVGNFNQWASGVICLQPNGQINYGFTPSPAPDVRPESVLALPNGQVLVGGNFTHFGGVPRGKIARLNPNGVVDESFQTEVVGSGRVVRILRMNDGRLLIGGTFTNVSGFPRRGVAILHPNGAVDNSFQLQTTSTGVFTVDALGVTADGKIVVGGWAQGGWRFPDGQIRNQVLRLNADGSLDKGFETAIQGPAGFNGYINDLLVLPDGRIYVVGRFNAVAGLSRRAVARLLPDGAVDPSFDPGQSSGQQHIETLVLDGLGRLLVGGGFSSFAGQTANGVARLWPDGSTDRSFGRLVGAAGFGVNALAVQPDGRILIGGNVSSPRFLCYRPDLTRYCGANNPPRFLATICRFRAKADGLFRIYGGDSVIAPPTIVNHPQDVLAAVQSTMLAVDVIGTPPLTYEWFRDGTPVSNSNTPWLDIAADRPGSYHVVVSNEYGTAISQAAQVNGLSTYAETQVVQFGAEGFSLSLQPPTGQQFTTQDVDQLSVAATEDFQTWFPLSNALRLIDGRIELTDPEAAAHAHRFYRFGLEQPAP
jgi:uncharacterized delta-60 repeat protein